MRTTTLLIALLATSAACQQALVKGCVLWNNQTDTCDICYRRQVATHGCGPLLPPTDNCLLHRGMLGQKTRCVQCKPGLANTDQYQCIPSNIFNCADAFQVGTKIKCLACGNGQYPNPDLTQCAPVTTGAIPNCLQGLYLESSYQCSRCDPGYVTRHSLKSCVLATPETTGCSLLAKDGTCMNCDVFAGYSMQKNGKCKFIKKE